MTIKEIVEQLEKCQFADKEGHDLAMNEAYLALRQMSQVESREDDTVVDHDELVGYIMRRAWEEHGEVFVYPKVDMVLEYEMDFLKEKGLIELHC